MSRALLIRTIAVGVLGGVFVWSVLERGVPKQREEVLAWALVAVFVATVGDGTLRAQRAVFDWVPFAALLLGYDYSRGAADTLGMPIHTQLPIVMDKVLFFGQVPTVWLQDRLGPFSGERWWEVGMSLTYVSHFTVPYIVAAAFWVASRTRFLAYIRRFISLTAAGLATYILVPTRPPWMAAEMGEIDPIDRVSTRGLRTIGWHSAESVVDRGQASFNQVAALPSLHAGFSMLVAVSLWPITPRWLRPLVAAYPLAMMFSLVVGGEHYVFDAWLGFLYVAGVCWFWNRWETRRATLPPASGGTARAQERAVHAQNIAIAGAGLGALAGSVPELGSDPEVDADPMSMPGGVAPG